MVTDSEPSGANSDLPVLETPAALPSVGARIVAFVAILIGGLCGGLIGYAVTDLQCTGDCATPSALGGVIGAVGGAGGVAVVAVLALRAMSEWNQISARDRPVRSRVPGQTWRR